MLHFQLDPRSAVPVYRQLMDQVQYYVASGALKPGHRLPSIRKASRELHVNPTTIVKAYSELEHAGVLVRRHGKGVFVAEQVSPLGESETRTALRERARSLAVHAVQLGADRELVLRIVGEELEALQGKQGEE